ncbi:MAG TPA: hypothetical protein VFZ66_29510 [Herpetosiphonaceae bacterium]
MSYNTPTGFLQGGTAFTTFAGGAPVPARVGWGTTALASGVGTIGIGFPVSAAFPVALGANIGAGTVSGAQIDPALFSAGSVIVRGLLGTAAAGGGGTIGVLAFGG